MQLIGLPDKYIVILRLESYIFFNHIRGDMIVLNFPGEKCGIVLVYICQRIVLK